MDPVLLLARLLHVLLGVFWVGAVLFTTLFLVPAMQDAGPDAGKVMAGLLRRRFMDVLPVVAIITILSGFWLYWHVSSGFSPEYMGSRSGMAFGTGGAITLIAFIIGFMIMRPAMTRAATLAPSAAQAAPEARAAQMAEVQALRQRGAQAGRWVAGLLTLAAVTMAIGRYV
jgi:uncharacterized membrane protein